MLQYTHAKLTVSLWFSSSALSAVNLISSAKLGLKKKMHVHTTDSLIWQIPNFDFAGRWFLWYRWELERGDNNFIITLWGTFFSSSASLPWRVVRAQHMVCWQALSIVIKLYCRKHAPYCCHSKNSHRLTGWLTTFRSLQQPWPRLTSLLPRPSEQLWMLFILNWEELDFLFHGGR